MSHYLKNTFFILFLLFTLQIFYNKAWAATASLSARSSDMACPVIVLPLHDDNCSIIIHTHTSDDPQCFTYRFTKHICDQLCCWQQIAYDAECCYCQKFLVQLRFLWQCDGCNWHENAMRAFVVIRLQIMFVYAGWRHQISPCNNDCDAGSPLGCHNDRVRNHNVMPRDTMMMRVITDAPTSDHVAIWYSMRGLGVGSGVVVTSTIKHFCIIQLCKISQMWCKTINSSTDKTMQLQKHALSYMLYPIKWNKTCFNTSLPTKNSYHRKTSDNGSNISDHIWSDSQIYFSAKLVTVLCNS